jgi:hypothetical protein
MWRADTSIGPRMQRAAVSVGLVAACLAASAAGVAAAQAPRDARIAGDVLVCNAPGNCMTREFTVSAFNQAGRKVAQTDTKSPDNAYRLHVSPGRYKLVAKSQGLVCRASATALAHHTTRRNITCLVP